MARESRRPTGNVLPSEGNMEAPLPRANIGQHFLIDREVLRHISELIPLGAQCVEIGAGAGALTAELLPRVDRLVAYEVDSRYQALLEELGQGYNSQVRIQNFLDVPNRELDGIGEYHITGNIPYHISEPLFAKLSRLEFESAVVLAGERMARALTAEHPGQEGWSRSSMLSRAYFNPEIIEAVPRTAFTPVPRADGAVIRLTKRDAVQGWQSDAVTQSYRALIEADEENSSAAKALRMIVVNAKGQIEAPINKAGNTMSNRAERRAGRVALRELVDQYNFGGPEAISNIKVSTTPETMLSIVSTVVDEKILSKPISGISNQNLKKLCSAIVSAINRRQESRKRT